MVNYSSERFISAFDRVRFDRSKSQRARESRNHLSRGKDECGRGGDDFRCCSNSRRRLLGRRRALSRRRGAESRRRGSSSRGAGCSGLRSRGAGRDGLCSCSEASEAMVVDRVGGGQWHFSALSWQWSERKGDSLRGSRVNERHNWTKCWRFGSAAEVDRSNFASNSGTPGCSEQRDSDRNWVDERWSCRLRCRLRLRARDISQPQVRDES